MDLTRLRLAILERDNLRCVRCGIFLSGIDYSLHHLVRGDRARNVASNLIALCGTGTTRCPGWVTEHPRRAAAEGGWVRLRHDRDAARPVLYRQPGRHGWYLPDDDFGLDLVRAA